MAIKSNSGEKITATDINALIDKIQEEYNDRTVTTTGTDRSGASASVNLKTLGTSLNDVNKNETIGSNLYKIVNTILVMNDVPNLLVNEQYDIIISDGIANNADLKDSLPTTCRGGCMGTCKSGCSGKSAGAAATYSNSFGGNGGTQGPGCTDPTSCNAACSGTCAAYCMGGCTGSCKGCTGGCSGGCTDTCGGCLGCGGTCGSACQGCHSTCTNHCDANCTNGCALNCKNGCYGSVKANEQGVNTYT